MNYNFFKLKYFAHHVDITRLIIFFNDYLYFEYHFQID